MAFAVYDNSPLLGYIEWVDLHIQYEGTTHAITDGFTAYRYVWWDPAVSTANLQVSDTLPTLSDDALLLFLNKDGIHVTVPKSTVVDGSLIVSESILASAIGANQIQADHLDAGAVTADKIAAGAVVAEKLGAWEMLVGQHIQSIDYDGTDVATGDATSGFRMEAGGDAEFNGVRVRGEIEASEFHGAPTASILGVNGTFDTDTSGWTAYTTDFPSSQIARVTSPVRSGSGALRIQSSSGAGDRAAYTEVTVAPGDIVHAAGWVRKGAVSTTPATWWWDTVTVNVDFYDASDTLVHQYFHESIQANAVQWLLLEVYAAVPLDLGVTKARVYFSSYASTSGNFALFVDDVTIGIAPMLEVPYMVTHEDGERKRALITPQQFAFESQLSNYPYGIEARHNAHTPSLRLVGPYGYGNQAAQIDLIHDLLSDLRIVRLSGSQVQVAADRFIIPSGGSDAMPPTVVDGDTDTGIYSHGSDALSLVVGGAGALRVDRGGPSSGRRVIFPGLPSGAGSANLRADSGVISFVSSTRRIKTDIETLDGSVVDRLRPVTYRSTTAMADPDKVYVGFVAEEVAEADPRLAEFDGEGEVNYFDQNGLMAHMVKELQSLRKRVAALEEQVTVGAEE